MTIIPIQKNNSGVAIIGAGVSGLTAAKSLLDKGLTPIIFEKSTRPYGLWNYGKEGGSPLYASLRVNSSKQMMAFSDFPYPPEVSNYPSHAEVKDYLQRYAKKHDLVKLIVFGTQVLNVEFLDNGFALTVRKDNEIETLYFKQLIISTGRFDLPKIPKVEGLSTFTGSVIHSQAYDTPEKFRDKNILVVGAASSALDIASELYGIAKKVTMCTRSIPWVIPRVIDGKPADHGLTWLKAKMPKKVREAAFQKILIKEYVKRGAPREIPSWPFKAPVLDLEKTRLIPHEKMIPLLINQEVLIYSKMKALKGDLISFECGNQVHAEVIIFATGYQTNFPFLAKEKVKVDNNYLGLYQHIFYPSNPNLAFVGVTTIVGATFPLVEMQSRFISEVFSGDVTLPNKAILQKEVLKYKADCDKRGIDPMRVQALEYLDRIAGIIGASPAILSHRKVFKELVFGPLTAFRYRLIGSNSNPEEAIRNIKSVCRDDVTE